MNEKQRFKKKKQARYHPWHLASKKTFYDTIISQ